MPDIFNTVLQNGLLLDEVKHGLVAAPFAAIVYHLTKSKKYIAVFYMLVYAIDADHLIDFWLYYGFSADISAFFTLEYFRITKRAIVVLHAWEWVFFLGILAYVRKNKLLWVTAIALLAHISWDVFGVGSVKFYSILHRTSNGFQVPHL